MLFGYLLSTALSFPALNKQILAVLDAIPGKTWEATDSSRVAQMSDADFQSMLMDRKFLKSGLPVSDRRCVAGKTNESVALSQHYEVSCDTKDAGCEGGYLKSAWEFFRKVGVPSLDCVDYTDEAYDDGVTTECPKKCDDGSDISLIKIRKRGKNVGGNVERMKAAIYNDGPLLARFDVYQDFKMYNKGISKHLTGEFLGGHAVELIGYGNKNGMDFWRVRNSWSEDWGEDGFFRIARGTNDCNFEVEAIAGKV